MNKILPYKILHLDHETLIAIERKVRGGQGVDEEVEIFEAYKGLMSNLPRIDPSVREYFGSRHVSMEEKIRDYKRDPAQIAADKLSRKVKSALKLIDAGFYKVVAEVDSKSAQDAVFLTTSVNMPWMDKPNKKVVPTEIAWRSTDSYDVIQRFDENFLKMPLGFVDLQEGIYASDLV